MTVQSGIFIIADLPAALRERIAAVQREHDPRLAKLWAPHLTLVGSSGIGPILADTPIDELRDRLEPIAADTAPIELAFGAPVRFPGRDIIVLPLDPHGPLRALHERIGAAGFRSYAARYPFTPHCTLTMYPPLTSERERRLLAIRFPESFVIDAMSVVLTREPQPVVPLLTLQFGGSSPG